MIRFSCPTCNKNFKVEDSNAGKTGKCPACGSAMRVPAASDEANDQPVQPEVAKKSPAIPPPPLPPRVSAIPAFNPSPPQVVAVQVVSPPRRSNSLGVASVILGILAFLICWIPFLGMLGLPFSILGIVLGGIGLLVALFRRGTGIGFAIAGIAISLVAAIMVGVTTHATAKAISQISKVSADQSAKENATNQTIIPQQDQTEHGAPATPPDNDPSNNVPAVASSLPKESSPNREPATEWADASSAVKQGDIQLRVDSVAIGFVKGKSFGEFTSQEKQLKITIEIKNSNPNRKIDYRGWSGSTSFLDDVAHLTDNFGNVYKRITFGLGSRVDGQVGSESIYPGKSISDVLVFEVPLDTVEYLHLELPAKNFEGEGKIRFQIPKAMIVTQ